MGQAVQLGAPSKLTRPAAQSSHDVDSRCGVYVPALQLVHRSARSLLKVPTAHSRHG
jgi:hypothetical protein